MRELRRSAGWLAAGLMGLALGCSDGAPELETDAVEGVLVSGASPEGSPPRIERLRLEPGEPLGGDRLRAVVTARDPDGDRVELGFRWTVDGEPLAADGSEITLGELEKGTEIEVEVTASDGTWESEPAVAYAEIRNQRPLMLGVRLDPAPTLSPGEKLVAVGLGRDEDGDELEYEYRWRVNGRPVDVEGPSFDTGSLDRGDEIQVRVRANDG
ncbi:MAG: hypothetical protein R3190_18930, partial [Thermoanaerobaculia bacterium]|nr:hypothetical protein [Thermoanaerobaculia bacterium]